jgi:hypothetical protein
MIRREEHLANAFGSMIVRRESSGIRTTSNWRQPENAKSRNTEIFDGMQISRECPKYRMIETAFDHPE